MQETRLPGLMMGGEFRQALTTAVGASFICGFPRYATLNSVLGSCGRRSRASVAPGGSKRFSCSGRASVKRIQMVKRPQAIAEADRAGFDLSLVDESLALSHDERARQHDQALALVLEFDRIRNERDAKPESIVATSR